MLVEFSESCSGNYSLWIQPFTPKQMTINNHSQEDNGAEKLAAGSELLPLSHPLAGQSLGTKAEF